MVRRWQQLPLDRALSCVPRVRLLLDDLAGCAIPAGSSAPAVPDLGPASVMDQLTVLVYDACEADRVDGLSQQLADLRHALA